MTTTEPKKIIIVEDEQDTAEMFAEMMRLSGYHVLKSYGGTQIGRASCRERV